MNQRKTPMHGRSGHAEAAWIAAIACIAGVLLAAGFFLFVRSPIILTPGGSSPTPLAVPTPLHTAAFDDGSALQILDVGEGRIEMGDIKPASRRSTSSRIRGFGGFGISSQVGVFKADGVVTGIKFESPPADLILAVRLVDPGGLPVRCRRVMMLGKIRANEGPDQDFQGWDALDAAAAEDPTMPEVLVQLSDGAGGWLDGAGPFSLDEDPESRGMVVFPVWPRSQAELQFRALRPGVEPVTWTLKNPSSTTQPEPWTAQGFPQVNTDADHELVLTGVKRVEGARMIQPRFEFESKVVGEPAGAGVDASAFECTCEELQGAWGTRTKETRVWLAQGSSATGFPYPPGENLLRFRFVIRASKIHPYPKEPAILIARAKLAADGKSLESRPEILTDSGITEVEMHDIQTGPDGGFEFTIKGRWENAAEEKAGKADIAGQDGIWVCFLNENTLSTGGVESTSHGSSSGGGVTEFDYSGRWSGALQPGDEILIGRTIRIPDREVFFTFEP